MTDNGQGSKEPWKVTKERILLWTGIVCLAVYMGSFIAGRQFPLEFLVLIAAMFGLSIAAWGDKK